VSIPKLIHTYWNSENPPKEYENTALWESLNPGWKVLFWHDRNLPTTFHNRALFNRARSISPKAFHQFQADVLRYDLLLQCGGIWVDMDIIPQKPLGPLCEGKSGWACWEEDGKWANNAVIAIEPGHPLMLEVVENLAANSYRFHKFAGNTVKSGPQFFTPLAIKHGLHLYPSTYFFPYSWRDVNVPGIEEKEFPEAYGIHRWNNRRNKK